MGGKSEQRSTGNSVLLNEQCSSFHPSFICRQLWAMAMPQIQGHTHRMIMSYMLFLMRCTQERKYRGGHLGGQVDSSAWGHHRRAEETHFDFENISHCSILMDVCLSEIRSLAK